MLHLYFQQKHQPSLHVTNQVYLSSDFTPQVLFCKRSPLKYKSLTKECLHKYNNTTIKTFSASSIFSLLSHFSCRTSAFSYPSFLWTDSRKRPPCFWKKTQKKLISDFLRPVYFYTTANIDWTQFC